MQWQLDGLIIHTKKWFLGARFLGAPPISLRQGRTPETGTARRAGRDAGGASDRKEGRQAREGGREAGRKPHVGSSETSDASCWFAVPTAPDCGCFSRPANPPIFRYGAFPENSVTQIESEISDGASAVLRPLSLASRRCQEITYIYIYIYT